MRLIGNCEIAGREGKRFRQDGLPKRRDYSNGGFVVKTNQADRPAMASNGGLDALRRGVPRV